MNHPALRHALVPLYFHLGGIGGGCLALGALAALSGIPDSHPAIRVALVSAAPLLALCGALLTLHLTRPERFWRVLTRFKWYSPVSVGAWALTGAGLAAAALAAWALASPPPELEAPSWAVRVLLAAAAGSGWFVAAYTGVLLAASSRPLWCETRWMGAVFCVTGLGTAAAWVSLGTALLGAGPASVRAGRVAGATLLLAALLWRHWLAALEDVPSRHGSLAHELDASGFGRWIRQGVLVGLALPALLLASGGKALVPGAILALVLGILPRAGVFLAGESPGRAGPTA